MYRPRFCCSCGEKIEREEWTIFKSRRFCPLCETEYKSVDYFLRGTALFAFVLGVFGFAGYFGIVGRSQFGPNAESKMTVSPAQPSKRANEGRDVDTRSAANGSPLQDNSSSRATISEQPPPAKKTSQEAVYYCGAPTKKGTPCSRRVKVKGYCWQHAKLADSVPAGNLY